MSSHLTGWCTSRSASSTFSSGTKDDRVERCIAAFIIALPRCCFTVIWSTDVNPDPSGILFPKTTVVVSCGICCMLSSARTGAFSSNLHQSSGGKIDQLWSGHRDGDTTAICGRRSTRSGLDTLLGHHHDSRQQPQRMAGSLVLCWKCSDRCFTMRQMYSSPGAVALRGKRGMQRPSSTTLEGTQHLLRRCGGSCLRWSKIENTKRPQEHYRHHNSSATTPAHETTH